MARLKVLHVRSHVLVGLGRIYADHLHEAVAGSRTAKILQDRAAAVAGYMGNVERHYPASQYGSEEGGLSAELESLALGSVKKQRMDASTSQFKHKNANLENATTHDPNKVFDNVRPVTGLVVDNDL